MILSQKVLKMPLAVIPVETGIQSFHGLGTSWIPACAAMKTFCGVSNDGVSEKLGEFRENGWIINTIYL